jgi:hypothetical protein
MKAGATIGLIVLTSIQLRKFLRIEKLFVEIVWYNLFNGNRQTYDQQFFAQYSELLETLKNQSTRKIYVVNTYVWIRPSLPVCNSLYRNFDSLFYAHYLV